MTSKKLMETPFEKRPYLGDQISLADYELVSMNASKVAMVRFVQSK